MVSVGVLLVTLKEAFDKQKQLELNSTCVSCGETTSGFKSASDDFSLEWWLVGIGLLFVALFLSSLLGFIQVNKWI